MATCLIMFRDKADGTIEIEAQHEGEFDPNIKSHAALDAVVKMLPMVFMPAQMNDQPISSVTMTNAETGQEMKFSDDGSSFLQTVPDPGKWSVTSVEHAELPPAPIVSAPVVPVNMVPQAAEVVDSAVAEAKPEPVAEVAPPEVEQAPDVAQDVAAPVPSEETMEEKLVDVVHKAEAAFEATIHNMFGAKKDE